MREIVLDTETTGLDPMSGDRIVEIGIVELFNHMPTGRTFHRYLDPQRTMPRDAFEIHGLGDDFLRGKPTFAAVARDFLDFVADAPMVIHNAPFDMGFINAELARAGLAALPAKQAIDTATIARRRYPGASNSLDALCRRFGVDNSGREKHGALLDSELLAEVYLELIGGRQPDLGFAVASRETDRPDPGSWRPSPRPQPLPPRVTQAERLAHDALITRLGAAAIWLRRA